VTTLADAVLPLIRTRADLSRWSASNAHGRQIYEAVDNLEAAIPTTDPAEVYAVTHKALASAIKVIARADDSSGIIGYACRRLLELHPTVAAAAQVPAGSLVDWMVRFQFDGDVDYFEIDPVAYAPALGKSGMATYRHWASPGWRPIGHDYQILGPALGHGRAVDPYRAGGQGHGCGAASWKRRGLDSRNVGPF
jgi:hypothetical protein